MGEACWRSARPANSLLEVPADDRMRFRPRRNLTKSVRRAEDRRDPSTRAHRALPARTAELPARGAFTWLLALRVRVPLGTRPMGV
jgi:hypothetical protein